MVARSMNKVSESRKIKYTIGKVDYFKEDNWIWSKVGSVGYLPQESPEVVIGRAHELKK